MTQKRRILVVDDEPDLRDLLCEEFNLSGYETETAENGVAAFELIQKQKFDLVISDVRMPGGDGIALLKQVNELEKKPKFFLLTGFADISEEEALSYGATRLLAKPCDLSTLMGHVEEALNQE